MKRRYAVYLGNELQIAGLGAMYEAILYIRENLMDENPDNITVTMATHQKFKPGPDMHMVDFLAWLGEAEET